MECQLRGLLMQSLEGDSVAYSRFLQIMSGYLRAMLRRRLGAFEDDVEDVLQEVLFAIHKGLHMYRHDVPLTAWVAAIVRHKVADFFRAHARREALHDPFDDESELFAQCETESNDAKHDVATLLERLPERQRSPIVHVKFDGLSVAEAALRTGLSQSAVKVGIHRGIKALSFMMRGAKK
ncbi:RNA polymerase sigma-70 factor (ECF subfamily) [Paraburkholderia sp. BL8N3]|nr:RNA polymerase sigma-70 factor (ECF subfamily) [Paraburkholderia sp. BL8N3]